MAYHDWGTALRTEDFSHFCSCFCRTSYNQYELDQTPAPKPQHKNNDKLFATYFEFLKVLMSALRNMRANYP